MPIRYLRAIAAIGVDTTLSEDIVTNTWHFRHENADANVTPQDSANDVVDQLEVFYQGIDDLLFPSTVGNTITVRVYNIEDAQPRVPLLTRNIAIVPSVEVPLPHEVAIALSMKSDVASGQNPARRRGRVFLGPIARTALGVEDNRVVVTEFVRNSIRDRAVEAFGTANGGPLNAEDPKLHIYSRTTDIQGASVPDSFFRVNTIEIDNAVDTIRSRGHDRTAKTTLRITN